MVRPVRYRAGVPIYHYRSDPGTPPVSVLRFDPASAPGHVHRHIHDFPALTYADRAIPLVPGSPRRPAPVGEVCVVAAGEILDPAVLAGGESMSGVFFDPMALGGDGRAPWLSWRAHPLLFPFLHGLPGGLLRLQIPPDRRPVWTATLAAIETELADRGPGYEQAALAHLTLLLVDVARLATDVVGDLRRSDQPLLAEVFDVIEQRYTETLSLREVATSVGMTPGHLTTLVRQRTGRTVVDWIIERRMVGARQLLTETDWPISEIARRSVSVTPATLPGSSDAATASLHASGAVAQQRRDNGADQFRPDPSRWPPGRSSGPVRPGR